MNQKFKTLLHKVLLVTLALPCSMLMTGVMSMDPAQRPLLNQQVSVHDMFKDLTEDEIVMLMEEGQQYIKYIEEQASPEERAAFQRMMQDTLQNFTEDDFAEIEKIVKVVEPILSEKESAPIQAEPIIEEPKKDDDKIVISGDSSLEYTLHRIQKTINSIILKAKSDPKLNNMLNAWPKKNDFNDMVRLLQSLNKKDLLVKLTAGKTEDVKKLFDTIENFSKRLDIENKQFTVADTFGLEVDEKTSTENSKKFNKILEFFAGSTETLLPMVVKFMQDYEPEALKIAKTMDEKAKSSLDAAKQIEKIKKPTDRSIGGYSSQSNAPYTGNKQGKYTPYYGSNYDASQGNDAPQSRRERNKMNADQSQSQIPTQASDLKSTEKVKTEAEKQKEKEAAEKKDKDTKSAKNFDDVIAKIEKYDDMFDNNAFMDYSNAMIKAGKMYDSFGKALLMSDKDIDIITDSTMKDSLTLEQTRLKKQYQDKLTEFGKNTKSAHTHYGDLKDAIEKIKPQINDIKSIAEATRASLNTMSLQELQKLENSPALKKLHTRFNAYESLFKNIQKDIKDKHERHMLEAADDKEINAYNELKSKAENLHGLEKTINDVKASLDLLKRAIQGEIKYKKRESNKR